MKYDCDVLIIGGGISGLAAAITASNKNLKTILIEKQNSIGGKAAVISQKGFTFDPGPSICIMKWVYEELFRSSGVDILDYLKFDKLDPVFSLIAQNGKTLVLPAGKNKFLEKIKEHSPSDVNGFKKLFALGESLYPAVKKTFFSKSYSSIADFASLDTLPFILHPILIKKYKSIIDDWFTDPQLRAWLYSFPTYTGQSYHSIAPGALLIPYIMICEGVYYPHGGINAIPNALAKRALELGVNIIKDAEAVKINIESNKIISVNLANKDVYYPKAVISSIDQIETQKLMNAPSEPTASYSYVSLQLGIKNKISGLTHHTACVPLDYEKYYEDLYSRHVFPTDPVIYIHTPSATNPECAPKNHESLFFVIPTHASGANWKQIEKNILKSLIKLLAKYNIKIDEKNIIASRIQTPEYFQKTHGNYLGSLFGPAESKRFLKTLPPPLQDKSIKNLVYCGGGVQPGAGMPMVTLSGQLAANYISKYI